ncbi:MAG: hypothetical protein ACYC11_05190, partial [Bellilinea sp.]
MSGRSSRKRRVNSISHLPKGDIEEQPIDKPISEMPDEIPLTYYDLVSYVEKVQRFNPTPLRLKTMQAIENITQRPLICYASQIYGNDRNAPTSIDHYDLLGFTDLINTTNGENVDIFLVSNGGNPEATERIVKLLRSQFSYIRFLIPAN